jgi:hypothetical protein
MHALEILLLAAGAVLWAIGQRKTRRDPVPIARSRRGGRVRWSQFASGFADDFSGMNHAAAASER